MRRAALGAACLAAAAGLAACGRRPISPPVVLISVDTLRADHLPAYGYKGVETPNLDALARDSIVFENAYSPVPLVRNMTKTAAVKRNSIRRGLGADRDL